MTALAGAIERKARELGVWSEDEYWFGQSDPLISRSPLQGWNLNGLGAEHRARDVLAAAWLLCVDQSADEWEPSPNPFNRRYMLAHQLLRDQESLAVRSDELSLSSEREESALGEVLALWMAGKLEERHVLGVETCTAARMATRAGDGPMEVSASFTVDDYATEQGWCASMLAAYTAGTRVQVLQYSRPTLVASA